VSYGGIPNGDFAAQHFNYLFSEFGSTLDDTQKTAHIQEVASAQDTATASLARWFSQSKRVVLTKSANAAAIAPDFKRSVVITPGGGTNDYGIKGAVYGITGESGTFEYDAVGLSPAIDVLTDTPTPVHSLGNLPHGAGSKFTHACQDVSTGNWIGVAGNSALVADVGFAWGPPSGLNFTAVGAPIAWVAQPNMSCASKPTSPGYPAEVRAFSFALTFASQDGGITVGDLTNVGYTGVGFSPAGNLFPPCWDSANNRWLTTVAKMDVDSGTLALNTTMAYSDNGEDWGKITTQMDSDILAITHVVEHRGWLWGIARMSASTSHGGLEVVYSTNDEVEANIIRWHRPGIVLSYTNLGYSSTAEKWYHHCSEIVPMDCYVLFQTTISLVPGDSFAAGKGLEYVMLRVGNAL
jgi:hypothetical protein